MARRCPICRNLVPTANIKVGDRENFRCSRCGDYAISGTALAMLEHKVVKDPLVRARLSHAIRSSASDRGSDFLVSSTNLNELLQRPLPGPKEQLRRFLLWMATQLEGNPHGRVAYPSAEFLAGLIGTVDGEAVKNLVDHAVAEAIVEQDGKTSALRLSIKGWELIERTAAQNEPSPAKVHTAAAEEIVKGICSRCGGERNAYRRASYTIDGDDGGLDWSDTIETLECCGCSILSVRRTERHEGWASGTFDPLTGEVYEDDGTKETYWPPLTKRKMPDWAEEIDDGALFAVYQEVYQALNSGLIILASIGIRTSIDRAMDLSIGSDLGTFYKKLSKMVEIGAIGEDEREILGIVTDAGSASAHRAFAPKPKTLDTIIDTAENFLKREFVLRKAVQDVKKATPPRQ